MTQPSRVIYLPPGVVAPQGPSSPPVPLNPGIPFDRTFFEHVLAPSIQNFCQQVGCVVPIVEVLTVDGVTHYVNGISGVSDQWVALQSAQPDHPHVMQVFVPYQTIFRVEIHPESDEKRRHLGFVLTSTAPAAVPDVERVVASKSTPAAAKEPGESATKRSAARAKK